ncbi:unnamed protein product [Prorocentrum cordatum]|uniref:Uncharacterized protein n=2 Tax=Prorocentrum cordatum TaxID=2364126 RepID=A0ABN9WCM4_9DINO|nr:unnamed protein product [Polarella glacialis]
MEISCWRRTRSLYEFATSCLMPRWLKTALPEQCCVGLAPPAGLTPETATVQAPPGGSTVAHLQGPELQQRGPGRMSSDALLGGQHLPPGQRERCGEVACRASSALRHWWKVTTSTEYFASLERRVVLKLVVAVVTEAFGIVSASGASWDHTLGICAVVPLCLFPIPYDSLCLDIFMAAWNFVYCYMVSLPGGLLWMILVIGWMRAGGIHSFALVPFLLLPLGERDLIERDYGCSGLDLQSFVAITILAVVWAFVAEWQQVDHFYRLQESTEVSQLLLGQATSGFCTLLRESGVVSDASSALMENLGMGIEGATVYDFVAPDDCAKVASLLRHRDTLPPSPILCTLHRKPIMTGAPGAQFEAKLVPYAVSESGIKVCLLKLGDIRRALWRPPRTGSTRRPPAPPRPPARPRAAARSRTCGRVRRERRRSTARRRASRSPRAPGRPP